MGGASLPTPSTPGYGTITRNDRTYVGCNCVIAFLLAGERLGLARGLLKEGLDIVQLTGNASASGGVHRLGAAFDTLQYSDPWVVIWREMGAAFWPRLDPNPGVPGDLWDNNQHGHGGIDCEHNSLIAYQNRAYRRGYNGLGQGWYGGTYQWGYGSKDTTFRPKVFRSWREGIAWADAQTAAINAAKKEDDMANVTDKQLERLLAASDRILGAFPQRYTHKDGTVNFTKGSDGVPVRYADSADVGSVLSQLKGENANLKAQLGGVNATVAALAKGQVLTADQILDAARAGATAALDAKITNADVNLNVTPQA